MRWSRHEPRCPLLPGQPQRDRTSHAIRFRSVASPPGAGIRQQNILRVSKLETTRLLRRLAAVLYDGLLLLGVWFVAAVPLPLLPESWRASVTGTWTLRTYLAAIAFVFYAWFWVHGGQTLGMRAWRTRVVRDDGSPLRWRDAAVRFVWAIPSWSLLGSGVVFSLFHPERLAWHDSVSRTRLVTLPRAGAGRKPRTA